MASQMSVQKAANILQELRDLQTEGVQLPYDATFILKMEAAGHVVDLDTGEITFNEADRPRNYTVTNLGEAALRWEEGDHV